MGKEKRSTCGLGVLLALASGCSPAIHRGVVAMKIDERTAHVCIEPSAAGVGDRLAVYRSECKPPTAAGLRARTGAYCERKLVGAATITSFFNEHYAEARLDEGSGFEEGDMVERER